MRVIRYTKKFKRDYKRVKAGLYQKILNKNFVEVLELLLADQVLPKKYLDHPLTGAWQDCRDCHIKPDLFLIYRKVDQESLELIRLGSHSELGL
jgi:mRNA interferase YafQ